MIISRGKIAAIVRAFKQRRDLPVVVVGSHKFVVIGLREKLATNCT